MKKSKSQLNEFIQHQSKMLLNKYNCNKIKFVNNLKQGYGTIANINYSFKFDIKMINNKRYLLIQK